MTFLFPFAFFLSFVLYSLFVPFFYRLSPARPNARSSHILDTASGGGVLFSLIFAFSSFLSILFGLQESVYLTLVPLICLPLAIVGFLDDCWDLSRRVRFCSQLLISFLLLYLSPTFSLLTGVSPLFILPFLSIVLVLFSTGFINLINFMDGLDGLVGGCMFVVLFTFSVFFAAPLSYFVLLASLLAFLCWNWSPARIFMGDSGSTFLAAVFVGFTFYASDLKQSFICLLVATPLLADSLICLIRRFFAGHHIFQSHRLHLFQRLHQAGWPHARVSLIYIVATLLLSFALLSGGTLWVFALAFAELLFGYLLDRRFAVPFALASRN